MADIVFDCTHCGQSLEVDSTAAGMTLPCPTCAHSITIPTITSMANRKRDSACPHCNRIIEYSPEQHGQLMKCPGCARVIEVGAVTPAATASQANALPGRHAINARPQERARKLHIKFRHIVAAFCALVVLCGVIIYVLSDDRQCRSVIYKVLDCMCREQDSSQYWVNGRQKWHPYGVSGGEILSASPLTIATQNIYNKALELMSNHIAMCEAAADIETITAFKEQIELLDSTRDSCNGRAYKLRLKCTNKLGVELVKMFTIAMLFRDGDWKVSYIYEEQLMCEEYSGPALLSNLLSIYGKSQ